MQDAREAFRLAVYRTKDGVQGYYDVLLEHAQNMIVYPDEMTIREKFLEGIPEDMLVSLICDGGLAPEVNTIEEFVSEAKAYENSLKTASHYLERAKSRGLKVPATTGSSQLRASSATKRREEIKTVARPGPSKALVKKPAFKSFLKASPAKGASYRKPAIARPGQHGPVAGPSGAKPTFANLPKVEGVAKSTTCYRCGRVGHFAKDCKEPEKPRKGGYIRAAHTAVPEESEGEEVDRESTQAQDSGPDEAEMGDDEAEEAPEDELVELMAYENDYYARESDDERLFAIREIDDSEMVGALTEMLEETNRVKMRKVVLRTTKETLTRPLLPSKAKECLATWETFNGMKAWTLWDSGSTTSGLTPAYAHVAKER
ncbi:hypothetical protein H0H92_011151 [Tricholoma furcatifolium]|nr:hypothetical protein H0H92_011151 [Tricholoma furcatifolium]